MATIPVSTSHLFAIAHGVDCAGPHRCLFCGAPASTPYSLLDTFTARDTLASPGSGHICAGCILCMEEVGTARYPDGTEKAWSKAFRRCHSWAITAESVTPCTGKHMDWMRRFLLDPPPPPWGVCLVGPTNGRQLLYRTPLNLDQASCAVLVEGELVSYHRQSLRLRLGLTLQLAAVGGRPSLDTAPSVSLASAVLIDYPELGSELLAYWQYVRTNPLSRLALFLTPKKEDCPRVLVELDASAPGTC